MGTLQCAGLAALALASIVICKLTPPGGPLKMPIEPVDSFMAMERFHYAVAISDADNDTIFECLQTVRKSIDPETKTAFYTFLLPTAGMELPFSIAPGDEPGTVIMKSPVDSTPRDGIIYYTDYEYCAVANLELTAERSQCTLWTTREVKDNVPQECIDHFVDACGVIVPAHSRDLCPDGEGDY